MENSVKVWGLDNASFGKDDGCQVAQEGIILIDTTCIDSYESIDYNRGSHWGVCADYEQTAP